MGTNMIGRFKLNNVYNEDCYKAIKDIPDKSVDLIYTDIPYEYINGGFGGGMLKSEARKKTYIDTIGKFDKGIDYKILDEFVRVCKYIYIYIWCSKEQILPLMKYFVEEKGCMFNILVWCKTNSTPFVNNTFLPNLEYCLVFREKGTKINDGYHLKSKWYMSGTNVEDKKNYGHATIKPLELVERHIALSTQENDIVLDPFAGSSTTLLAAKHLKRRYIGFEIDKEYYDISVKRLSGENIKGELNLFDIDYD